MRKALSLVTPAYLLLASCAPAVVQQSVQLAPGGGTSLRLTRPVSVPLSTGYSTRLRADTRWDLVGNLPQGDVYKTRDQIVTVEGSDIHEAYIVVSQGSLVGFYLPVKRTFSPVAPSQPLSLEP
jgi:hypothetical protein